jgi:arsenate reductase
MGHWGVADPAAYEGPEDEKRRRFAISYRELENRIKLFTHLKTETLDRLALEQRVKEIGDSQLSDTADRSR